MFLAVLLPVWGVSAKVTTAPEFSAPVGQRVIWEVAGDQPGPTWFRYRVRPQGGEFSTVRDFGPETVLFWTASKEGTYELEVTSRDVASGGLSTETKLFEITSRVVDGSQTVSALDHPLVFLYSAPPCPEGGTMRVRFGNRATGAASATITPPQRCNDGVTSMNFYLAGLRANTKYSAEHVVRLPNGTIRGKAVHFETSDAGVTLAANTVSIPARPGDTYGVVLQSALSQPAAATDLEGNLIWYYDGSLSFLTRPEAGGRFMGILEDLRATPDRQVFRLFDLAGFTLKETNAARVNEQLAARGMRPITGFHHEARLLPDGRFLVLANTEQLMTGVQGEGEVDVLSDMILVFDSELQLAWAWDAFDHLDVRRKATLGETCEPQGGGCPPFYLAPVANDWLHGNSLQLTPDGNILYSARHQDWLIKINYDNGNGSGGVMWRLGKDGDFQAVSHDALPWFSHQHDGGFADAEGTLTVFDNGNIRADSDPKAHSRGQMWKIDEASRRATLALNADLGTYALAVGSAYKMEEGRYHFHAGYVLGAPPSAHTIEVDKSGTPVFTMDTPAPIYRAFRLKDLYTPTSY